jgi:hypothetical protein
LTIFARGARRLALGQRVDVLHAALDLAPHGVLPSRKRASSRQMKNWLLALSGTWLRAIEQDAAHVRLGG